MALILILLSFSITLFFRFQNSSPGDFEVYRLALERLDTGVSVYQILDLNPFKYSPAFLWVFKWAFGWSSNPWPWFLGVSLGAWCGSLWMLLKSLRVGGRIGAISLLIALLLGFRGILETLGYGQVDLLLHSVILIAYSRWMGGFSDRWRGLESILIGVGFAMVVLVKPPFLLLMVPFFLERNWTVAGSMALALIAFLGVPFVMKGGVGGTVLYSEWFALLQQQHTPEYLTGNMVQNLSASISRWFGVAKEVHRIQHGVEFLALCFFGGLWFRRVRMAPGWILSFLPLHFLVYPVTYRTTLFSLIPAYLWLLWTIFKKRATWYSRVPGLLSAFLLLLATREVAQFVGIQDWDRLSALGIYAVAAFLLWVAVLGARSSESVEKGMSASFC